jgi:hypothetical protein
MSYASGGLIQASDYDTQVGSVNSIWSIGSGNSGYGQTVIPDVTAGSQVLASEWNTYFNAINSMASHQGTAITAIPAATAGSAITYLNQLATDVSSVTNARLNAATQGSTTSTVVTSTSTWDNNIQFTFTVTFANDNAARYFFNAGGQVGFTYSHPTGTSINQLINSLCSNFGTVWFSSPNSGTISLSSSNYNGVTKIGGSNPPPTVINSNNGFYSIYPTGTNVLLTQYSSGSYLAYIGTFLRVTANYNGSGVLTFTGIIDEVPDGAIVSAGTVGTLIVRPPSSTYLSNTWGTPLVNGSYSINV